MIDGARHKAACRGSNSLHTGPFRSRLTAAIRGSVSETPDQKKKKKKSILLLVLYLEMLRYFVMRRTVFCARSLSWAGLEKRIPGHVDGASGAPGPRQAPVPRQVEAAWRRGGGSSVAGARTGTRTGGSVAGGSVAGTATATAGGTATATNTAAATGAGNSAAAEDADPEALVRRLRVLVGRVSGEGCSGRSRACAVVTHVWSSVPLYVCLFVFLFAMGEGVCLGGGGGINPTLPTSR
jgi:hypothetical protein